jgi:hypothetical protein
MPVSSEIIVWNSKMACSVPCANSAWYGRVGREEFAALHQRVDYDRPVVEVSSGSEKTGVAFAVFFGALLEPVHDFRLGHLPRDG